MHRPILTCAFVVFASAALSAQQSSPSDPYQGTSNPPADDTITASQPEQPKPPAGKPLVVQPAPAPVVQQPAPQAAAPSKPSSVDPATNFPSEDSGDGTDAGIVQVAPDPEPTQRSPRLSSRVADPDGDIVHPTPLGPGMLGDGVTIRVHLLTRLSTADAQEGEPFRTKVASDVLQNGEVLIPAGSEIDGKIADVSSGQAGGHGSIRLRPDVVILPNGSRFQLDAQVTGTPGSRTNVSGEGVINAGSRFKKDGIEYGGAMGVGAVTGAALGGPMGALAGTLVGAGAVTVHLLVDHPQAVLEPGTVLLFTLTEPLNLVASKPEGN